MSSVFAAKFQRRLKSDFEPYMKRLIADHKSGINHIRLSQKIEYVLKAFTKRRRQNFKSYRKIEYRGGAGTVARYIECVFFVLQNSVFIKRKKQAVNKAVMLRRITAQKPLNDRDITAHTRRDRYNAFLFLTVFFFFHLVVSRILIL